MGLLKAKENLAAPFLKFFITFGFPLDPNDYISNQNDNVLNAKQLTTALEEKIMNESKKHINE